MLFFTIHSLKLFRTSSRSSSECRSFRGGEAEKEGENLREHWGLKGSNPSFVLPVF